MRYDFYEDPQLKKTTAKGVGESIGDTLGQAIQGLASWIGLDGLLKEWNSQTHISTKRKIQSLRTKIRELQNKGEIDLDALDKQIERLNLGGYNLTGRAAQVAGQYKKSLEDKRGKLLQDIKHNEVQYSKMIQDLDKADQGSSDISASGARTSREIADKVEQAIGGK